MEAYALIDDEALQAPREGASSLDGASSSLADVVAVTRASATDGTFLATLLGFVLMLLYTLADAHKAWEAEHQLTMNVCMAVLCWAFLPIVAPFIRSPCAATAAGSRLQAAAWALGLLADYSLLVGTVAFAGLGVLLFLAGRAPAYLNALLLVECVGCWGFLISACAYAGSWVLGTPALPVAAGAAGAADAAGTEAGAAGAADAAGAEAAAALARALAVERLEWWGHALNIGGSLFYVLASTSSTLLVLAGGQDPNQERLRQTMAQTFVIGDFFWTCDAAVFLGLWVREALKAQRAKRALDAAGAGEKAP
jgi:hypothetical protein